MLRRALAHVRRLRVDRDEDVPAAAARGAVGGTGAARAGVRCGAGAAVVAEYPPASFNATKYGSAAFWAANAAMADREMTCAARPARSLR